MFGFVVTGSGARVEFHEETVEAAKRRAQHLSDALELPLLLESHGEIEPGSGGLRMHLRPMPDTTTAEMLDAQVAQEETEQKPAKPATKPPTDEQAPMSKRLVPRDVK